MGLADRQEEVDVAIVGGGVGGCYLGHRLASGALGRELGRGSPLLPLLHRREKLAVGLYEGSGRIGGRLWSVRLPGLPGVAAELGGMRFHEQLHIVSDLIHHLGLGSQVTDFTFGQPENLTYVRGLRFRQRELTGAALAEHPGAIPYRLRPSEQGLGLEGLEQRVVDTALPDFSTLRARYHAAFDARRWEEAEETVREYERRRDGVTVDGGSLHALSWWALLGLVLSQEAISLLQDTGGYEGLAANGNAAGWLDVLFHAPVQGGYRCLRGGFDALPRALHERFLAAGGTTRLHHVLRRLDRRDAGAGGPVYELLFQRGACGEGDGAGGWTRVRARCVLLALPQRALELLDPETFLLQDDTLRRNLRSVRGVAAVKLFLAYPFAWWEQAGVSRGRSTTDLPLRQLWYWGVESGATGGAGPAASSRPALLLAAYASGTAAEYWSSLRSGDVYADAPGSHGPGHPALPAEAPASRRMVERAHAMLMELHGVDRAPLPTAARCQDWSEEPHGAGWHVWREHHVAHEVIPAVRQPLPDEHVFIVSDCWSHDPGSVHGTLSTAECTLQDHLGLPWPSWLRREGTRLGPRRRSAEHPSQGDAPPCR